MFLYSIHGFDRFLSPTFEYFWHLLTSFIQNGMFCLSCPSSTPVALSSQTSFSGIQNAQDGMRWDLCVKDEAIPFLEFCCQIMQFMIWCVLQRKVIYLWILMTHIYIYIYIHIYIWYTYIYILYIYIYTHIYISYTYIQYIYYIHIQYIYNIYSDGGIPIAFHFPTSSCLLEAPNIHVASDPRTAACPRWSHRTFEKGGAVLLAGSGYTKMIQVWYIYIYLPGIQCDAPL